MKTDTSFELIALVGGSGAGKTWLADRLCQEFGDEATSLSLDDFYRDLSHLSLAEREGVNFDAPEAIDWPLFEAVLRQLQNGSTVAAPRYSFVSHTRSDEWEPRRPRPFIFVEGLWLLRPPSIRALFDFTVFLDCAESLRWQRRLARDLNERGRTTDSIRRQFWSVVAPMHQRFVQGQQARADLVLEPPLSQTDFGGLLATIRALRGEPDPTPLAITTSRSNMPQVAALQSL
jgi:uridine kinase